MKEIVIAFFVVFYFEDLDSDTMRSRISRLGIDGSEEVIVTSHLIV